MARLKDIENRVTVGVCFRGAFKVTILLHGVKYTECSYNTLAYDRIVNRHYTTDGAHLYGYTLKQAYKALYDECKQKAMH